MLSTLERKVGQFIRAEGLFDSSEKVLLAISGGADSTALVHILAALQRTEPYAGKFHCVHLNHQLRAEQADCDERFVIALAASLGLKVTAERMDVRGFADRKKLSIETAARHLRIVNLIAIAKKQGCSVVAMAHHKNDNAETVIQRLARGTGFRGLGGIWPVREFSEGITFVRPLLCVSRNEIIEYLRQRHLEWCTDHTNTDCTFRRNYIRHRLIPHLQEDCKESISGLLSDLSLAARRLYTLICERADSIWPTVADCKGGNIVALDLNWFARESVMVQVEMVRRALISIGSGERYLTEQHYRRVLELAKEAAHARMVDLPRGYTVRREYKSLVFERYAKRPNMPAGTCESVELVVPGQTEFGEYLIDASIRNTEQDRPIDVANDSDSSIKYRYSESFDLDKIKLPLKTRYRRAGDAFVPLGMQAEKKVGKFLTAARVERDVRDGSIVISDSKKIIWVCPVRMSEQAKVTKSTQRVLKLKVFTTSHQETKDA